MLTVSVDLAKVPAATVLCAICWYAGAAMVDSPVVGAENAAVLAAAVAPNVTVEAFDAPLGPVAMVRHVEA